MRTPPTTLKTQLRVNCIIYAHIFFVYHRPTIRYLSLFGNKCYDFTRQFVTARDTHMGTTPCSRFVCTTKTANVPIHRYIVIGHQIYQGQSTQYYK